MHDHSHHTHHHHAGEVGGSFAALRTAFYINLAFLAVEIVGGLICGSLALLADAGHMLSDVGALGLALLVARVTLRPPTPKRSYGYGRAEILSGLVNGLTLFLVVGIILWEAFRRMIHPPEVDARIMLPVAVAGLIANAVSAWLLMRHRDENLNIRGAFLHLAADTAGSVGVILAAVAVWYGGWTIADPIASIVIGVLILWSAWGLVKESTHILLEGTPPGVRLADIRNGLAAIEGVIDCHDVHAWQVGSGEPVFTCHLTIHNDADGERVLCDARKWIIETQNIEHVTLQVERNSCGEASHP